MIDVRLLLLLLACAITSGCATPFGKKVNSAVAERVDLGDGMIFDLVPVSLGSKAADAAYPGSGKIIDAIEAKLKGQRDAKLGPFNGLPYTTQRQVVLKADLAAKLGRAILSEQEIENIIEVLTPIVPGSITRVIEPKNFGTKTVAPVAGTNIVDGSEPTDRPISALTNLPAEVKTQLDGVFK